MAYYFNQLRDYAQNTFYTQNTQNKVAEFNAPLFVQTDTNTSSRTEVNSQNYKEVQKNGVKSSVLRKNNNGNINICFKLCKFCK